MEILSQPFGTPPPSPANDFSYELSESVAVPRRLLSVPSILYEPQPKVTPQSEDSAASPEQQQQQQTSKLCGLNAVSTQSAFISIIDPLERLENTTQNDLSRSNESSYSPLVSSTQSGKKHCFSSPKPAATVATLETLCSASEVEFILCNRSSSTISMVGSPTAPTSPLWSDFNQQQESHLDSTSQDIALMLPLSHSPSLLQEESPLLLPSDAINVTPQTTIDTSRKSGPWGGPFSASPLALETYQDRSVTTELVCTTASPGAHFETTRQQLNSPSLPSLPYLRQVVAKDSNMLTDVQASRLPPGFILDYERVQGWDKEGRYFVACVPLLVPSHHCDQYGAATGSTVENVVKTNEGSRLWVTSDDSSSGLPSRQTSVESSENGGEESYYSSRTIGILMSDVKTTQGPRKAGDWKDAQQEHHKLHEEQVSVTESYMDSNPKRAYLKAKARLRAAELARQRTKKIGGGKAQRKRRTKRSLASATTVTAVGHPIIHPHYNDFFTLQSSSATGNSPSAPEGGSTIVCPHQC